MMLLNCSVNSEQKRLATVLCAGLETPGGPIINVSITFYTTRRDLAIGSRRYRRSDWIIVNSHVFLSDHAFAPKGQMTSLKKKSILI